MSNCHFNVWRTLKCQTDSTVLTEDTDSFIIGDYVWVGGNKPGRIAYIGETQFAPGDWAGIVLDQPIGKFKLNFCSLKNICFELFIFLQLDCSNDRLKLMNFE